MAANSYYQNVPVYPTQADLSDISRTPTPLKPLSLSSHQQLQQDDDPLHHVRRVDETLKYRIRILRVVSRILATLISLAVLIPITITLRKFLQTKDVFRDVQTPTGVVSRTAWSKTTKAWPTYMYFSVALSSFILNLSALIGYFFSVKTANMVSTTATTFSGLIMVANVVVWSVAAAIYKQQKEVTDSSGKHDDLWGWTCSPAAKAIQNAFKDKVPFDEYCSIQSASWYAGLIQVGAMILSVIIFVLAWRRTKVRKEFRSSMTDRLVQPEY